MPTQLPLREQYRRLRWLLALAPPKDPTVLAKLQARIDSLWEQIQKERAT